MSLQMRRVILFVKDMTAMKNFYRDVLGLRVKGDPDDREWIELDAGGCAIGLHRGGRGHAERGEPKIVFGSDDVAATRSRLIAQGARFGKVMDFDGLHLCEGKDPEGNVIQLSNRP